MTVSSSKGKRWTVGDIVRRAYQYAGLLEASQVPNSADERLGRELLEDVLDALATEGVRARVLTTEDVDVQPNVETYTLSSTTLDVLDPAAWYADGSTSETILRQITLEEWQRLGSRATSGVPSRFYVDRNGDTLQVKFWPIPDADGTVRLTVERHLADVGDSKATLDLETWWHDYVRTALAAQLAEAKSMTHDKVMRLESRAARLLIKAKGKSAQRPGGQVYPSPLTAWRYGR